MSDDSEIELKLSLPDRFRKKIEDTPALREARRFAKLNHLTSVYFDTPNCYLQDAGISLRVRSDGKRHVQTVKRAQGSNIMSRGEWETEVAGPGPDFGAIKDVALRRLLSNKVRHTLKPLFETQINRKTIPLRVGDTSIELALDSGQIKAEGHSEHVSEIEIELLSGDRAALFQLARTLSEAAPVQLSGRSKSARGYDLVKGKSGQAVTAADVALRDGSSTAEAFQVIAESCLGQVAANCDAVRRGDAEGVHQMRVGLRRLRAALSIFSKMLDDQEIASIKSDLKWLTDELGPARQLHVLLAEVIEPLRGSDEHDLDSLDSEIKRRRSQAERRAVTAVESQRFRNLLLGVLEWIHVGKWRTTGDEHLDAIRQRPIDDFASEALDRLSAKIAKQGKKLAKLDPAKRHKLRIAAKKLRYGSEFFASLFPKAKRRRKGFLKDLADLQDCLGSLNDTAAHRALSATIAKEMPAGAEGSIEIAYQAGIVSGREEMRGERALASSEDVCRRFAKFKPFWR